ncbi:MAG: hypothetical protein KAI70_07205 [Candidatus Omnitrophica bacterium]|nr:hypothetical protein [Candidatus Omnitrophota bacterium]
MGIIEIIKKGFVETAKLINVVLVFFVFNAVIGLISLPLSNPEKAGNPGTVLVSVLFSILFFLAFILLQGGALGIIKDKIKTGAVNLSRFVDYGKQFYVRILSLLLLYVLLAIGAVLLLSLVSAGILLLGDNIITRTLVALAVTAAAVTIITYLVYPIYIIVGEDMAALAAFKKGIAVAKVNFTRTLGLFMSMLLVSLVISLGVGFLVGIVTMPLPVGFSQVIVAIANAGVQSYISIVMMVVFMSFYFSLDSGTLGKGEGTPRMGE